MPLFRRRRRDKDEGNAPPVSAEGLTVEVLRSGPLPTVVVVGTVTIDSSPRLRSVLHEVIGDCAGSALVVDLSGVSHLDSSGVATLLEAARIARGRGVSLRLVGLSSELGFIAEAAGLDRIFHTLGSELELR
jgi:anti-sigma B factor antagonist